MESISLTAISGLVVYVLVQAIKNKWLSFIPSKWMVFLVPLAAAFASAGAASLGRPNDPSLFDLNALLGGAGASALAYQVGKLLGINDKLGKLILPKD